MHCQWLLGRWRGAASNANRRAADAAVDMAKVTNRLVDASNQTPFPNVRPLQFHDQARIEAAVGGRSIRDGRKSRST